MKTFILCIALLASACAAEVEGPAVVIRQGTSFTDVEMKYIQSGVATWRELGFHLETESDLPECGRYWYQDGEIDCKITIDLTMEHLESDGHEYAGLAQRDSRDIILSDHFHMEQFNYNLAIELQIAAAHEFGHILLDTGHLPDGVKGLMSAPYAMGGGDAGTEPTQADYDLACERIGICL
jgi:hypothetical protein